MGGSARRTVRLGPAQLRAAARVLRRIGLRVEIDLPHLAAPPRRGKHAGIVGRIRLELEPLLPEGLAVAEGVSVELGDGEAQRPYAIPDLTVCPGEFLDSDDASLHPQAVDIAVEVVTSDAADEQIVETVAGYGRAGLRALLVVDPRTDKGSWTLYTEPVAGHYWLTRHGGFAESVPLAFLGAELATGRLRRYADGNQPPRPPSAPRT